mgnify:CR=1 FL=1
MRRPPRSPASPRARKSPSPGSCAGAWGASSCPTWPPSCRPCSPPRALPRAHFALIERLAAINALNAEAVVKQDAVAYVRTNLEFHRTLYLRAQAPAMLAICETVWLQLGPTMRALYSKLRRKDPPQHHRMILAALKAGDEPGLRLAVRTDVTQGLRHLAS